MGSETLDTLARAGYFPDIGCHFMAWAARIDPSGGDPLALAAGLVSRAAESGDVCIDLRRLAEAPLPEAPSGVRGFRLPPLAGWLASLRQSPVVGDPGEWRPMVLTPEGRLYLHRYHAFESRLARGLLSRCEPPATPADPGRVRKVLERFFPPADADGGCDWQKVAAVSALTGRLSVLSGGPGTGKTTAVGRILAVLAALCPERPPRILLTAPTGKAAARLADSMRTFREGLAGDPALQRVLPGEAATIHRLIHSRRRPWYGTEGDPPPLPADVVVVDEASMVDLALMARLVAAVPDAARLIVLGDRDQLASVEAGAVFGDICHPAADGRYTEGFRKAYRSAAGEELPEAGGHPAERAPLLDRITVLRKNYRFGEDSAVGRLARAVTAGDPDAVIACLAAGDPAVQWHRPGESDFDAFLWNAAREGYRDLSGAADPRSAIGGLDRFRILCALRVGPLGARRLSERVEERVRDRQGVGAGGRWYPGRPVVVTRNDYASGLFNGDCGVAMAEDGVFRVYFEGREGGLRRFHPARVPEHESVYATTVHKSQGSEYDEVLLVLPASDAPVLTRELLYTAVTRARRRVALWGDEEMVRAAVARRVERASGLMERLWPVEGAP